MAMTAAEKMQIIVSLTNNVGSGERAVLASMKSMASQASEILNRIGEGSTSALARMAEQAKSARFAPLMGARAHFAEMKTGLAELGEATGVARFREQLGETHEGVHRLHESISGLLPAAAGLGALLSVREFAESMRKSAEYAEQLSITSKATGLSATQLGGFQYAAKIAGVDTTVANRAIEYLNRNLGEFQAGHASKDVKQVFGQLGVKPGMDTSAVMARLEDQLHALTASGQFAAASRVAGSVLGQRSGVALLPLLGQGSAELNKQAARAAHFGLAPTDEMADTGEKFNQSLKDMDAAVGGLQLAISTKLFPVLSPVIEEMSEWIARNREWIATNIASEVRSLVNAARSIDWSSIAAGARGLGDAAVFATGHLKLIEIGLGSIAVIKLIGVAQELYGVGVAAASTAARLVAIPVAGLISSVATLIPMIRSLRDVWVVLDVAMDANPLGAAVVAAVALGAAAYELCEHWDRVKSFFGDLWRGVVAAFQWGEGEIKAVIGKIDNLMPTMPAWLSQAAGWVEHVGGVITHEMALPGPGGTVAPALPFGRNVAPLHPALAAPIYPRSNAGAPSAKVQVTSRVILDHRNAPPGTTATAVQPAPVDVDLGPAWDW